MDELESRLSEDLTRQADQLPTFTGNFAAVRRRGRNRRLAVRGAGTLGALVLLGGGVTVLAGLRAEEPDSVATETPVPEAGPTEMPTPTPAPAPTPVPTPQDATVLVEPAETASPDDASLLVATGWGVGLVNSTGVHFAPIACCEADEFAWWDQAGIDVDGQHIDEGAVTVRDDLRGGLVTASSNGLFWMPPARLADGLAPLTIDAGDRLKLWDVGEVEGAIQVLYSVVGPDSSVLLAKTLDGFAEQTESRVVESDIWSIDSASWLSDGGWLTLKSANDGSCSWVELTPAPGSASDLASPLPKPGDIATCENQSIAVATVDDSGTLLATSEFDAEGRAELVIYDLTTTGEPVRVELSDTVDGQGLWSEIDFLAPRVLVSRGAGMDMSLWSTLDETVLVDIDSGARQPLGVFGALSLPREPVSTLGLDAVDPADSPLRFTLDRAIPDPEPLPTTKPEPAAVAIPQPTATSKSTDLASGQLAGDDTCVDFAGFITCVGGGYQRAFTDADNRFGPGKGGPPPTSEDGEPPPSGETIWTSGAAKLTLTNDGDSVAVISVVPTDSATDAELFGGAMTVGDVLATLGTSTEVSNTAGVGRQVLWLSYQTDKGFVSYGFTQFAGGEQPLLGEGEVALPESYSALPVNSYLARADG